MAEASKARSIQLAAVDALAVIGSPKRYPFLKSAFFSADREMSQRAGQALAVLGYPELNGKRIAAARDGIILR